jgi:hypothetical protein
MIEINRVAYVDYLRRLGREERARTEHDRRLRVIRNQPRNRHAWKGKR